MRTNIPHIYAIGDIAKPPSWRTSVHEVTSQRRPLRAENPTSTRADPSAGVYRSEIAWRTNEEEAKEQGVKFGLRNSLGCLGRAIANAATRASPS